MGTVSFTAKGAHASKDDDYYMVGFADDEFETEQYILLQKTYEFDEQDMTLGMAGEYFELNGQENSGYNCCRQAILFDDRFSIGLDADSESVDRIEVIFDGVQITSELKQYLVEILGSKLTIQ